MEGESGEAGEVVDAKVVQEGDGVGIETRLIGVESKLAQTFARPPRGEEVRHPVLPLSINSQ